MFTFVLQHLSFVIYTFFAFVFFVLAWLHLDATADIRKNKSLLFRFVGYLGLSLAFIFRVFSYVHPLIEVISMLLSLLGISALAWGIRQEPVLSMLEGEDHKKKHKEKKLHSAFPWWLVLLPFLSGIVGLFASYLVWKRYKSSHYYNYKLLYLGLLTFSLSQLIYGTLPFAGSDIVLLQNVFSSIGLIWFVQHALIIASMGFLAAWFWKYINFRVHPKLFITFAAIAVVTSTLAALFYSIFLFQNAERDVFRQLGKDVQVLELSVNNLEESSLTAATLLAKTGDARAALSSTDLKSLYNTALLYADETQGLDFIIFTDTAAQVLVNTANQSQIGESLTDDDLVLYALNEGKSRVSITTNPGVLADNLVIKAVHPITSSEGKLIGVVQTGVVIDDAFTDRVKKETGLEAAVYIGDQRSASTLIDPDLARRENTVDINPAVQEQVLENGEVFAGNVHVLGDDYHGAYAPLKNTNDEIIGMLFVGRPQDLLIDTLNRSTINTFFVSVLGSMVALIPAYFLASKIEQGGV